MERVVGVAPRRAASRVADLRLSRSRQIASGPLSIRLARKLMRDAVGAAWNSTTFPRVSPRDKESNNAHLAPLFEFLKPPTNSPTGRSNLSTIFISTTAFLSNLRIPRLPAFFEIIIQKYAVFPPRARKWDASSFLFFSPPFYYSRSSRILESYVGPPSWKERHKFSRQAEDLGFLERVLANSVLTPMIENWRVGYTGEFCSEVGGRGGESARS